MILVTGSTGNLGAAVIENLLKNIPASNIVALARDENKASWLKEKGVEVRIGDYTDKASMAKALQGIQKLLLVSSTSMDRLQEHKNAIDAAKQVGVKQIYYTSGAIKNINTTPLKPLYSSHELTELYIRQSGLEYTIFQNSLYCETIPLFIGQKA